MEKMKFKLGFFQGYLEEKQNGRGDATVVFILIAWVESDAMGHDKAV